MDPVFTAFPEGAVVCAPGDYLVCRLQADDWRVYRVDDLLLVKRLVPLTNDPGTLMLDEHMHDSVGAAYANEIQLLITPFEPGFDDEARAQQAIDQQALRAGATGLLRPAREFSARDCRVVRPQATPG